MALKHYLLAEKKNINTADLSSFNFKRYIEYYFILGV